MKTTKKCCADCAKSLRACRRELSAAKRTIERVTTEALVSAGIFARELMRPPLTIRAFAAALGGERDQDVGRWLSGRVSARGRERIRPKVDAWLGVQLASTKYTPEVIASLDDDSVRGIIYWARLVTMPASPGGYPLAGTP